MTAGSLSGKRALITGSSSGIGAETARWLARAGAAVIVHGRNPDKIAAVEAELKALGAEVASVSGALDDPDGQRDRRQSDFDDPRLQGGEIGHPSPFRTRRMGLAGGR